MVYAIQKLFAEIGEAGCYFICMCIVAMKAMLRQFDIIEAFCDAEANGHVHYNYKNTEDPKNCLVQDSQKLMAFLCPGFDVSYRMAGPLYKPADDEYCIEEWHWPNKAKVSIHFVLPEYDPLGESNTKKFGKIHSKRIFKITKKES